MALDGPARDRELRGEANVREEEGQDADVDHNYRRRVHGATRAEMVPRDAEINANGSSRTQVMLALLCALYCQCGERVYTAGNNNRRNEQEPLIVEGKPIPPP